MRLRSFALSVLAFVLVCYKAQGQDGVITLVNPSFEDLPRHSKPPRGWTDCGFQGETPPDVQPSGTFSVTKLPQEGNTYLGMVVRDNDTWEAVSQSLSAPLKKGQCYEFSIFLCRSELYVSFSRLSDETANYTTPAKLRIYGGFDYCDKQYLLAESNLVINTRWLEYRFKIEPIENYTHIVLEAFYKTPTLFPYNGNILIDNASAFVPIPCDEELTEKITPPKSPDTLKKTSQTPPKRPDTVAKTPPSTPSKPAETPKPAQEAKTAVVEDVDFTQLRRTDIRKGQTLRVNDILFEMDKATITRESFGTLNQIYQFLAANSDVSIEVGGHTNGLCSESYCDELSTSRAKAVVEYLVQKGISRSRLQYKGYGKRFPVASNDTPDGRRKNQRVEIKILSMNG